MLEEDILAYNPNAPWQLWFGEYDKIFYEIRLLNGAVIEFCWPNAGKMSATDGSGRQWEPWERIEYRPGRHPMDVPDAYTDGKYGQIVK